MLNVYTCLILRWMVILFVPNFGSSLNAWDKVRIPTKQVCYDVPIMTDPGPLEHLEKAIFEKMFVSWLQELQKRLQLENKLIEKGRAIKLNERKCDLSMTRNFRIDPIIRTREISQLPFEYVSNQLYITYNLPSYNIINGLPMLEITGIQGSIYQSHCKTLVKAQICDPKRKYRTINGQCNNLQNPNWGSSMTCHSRLLPPNYVGISGFPVSVDGRPLPEPRQLSLHVHDHLHRPTNYANHMYMFFGQLLEHDLTQTPLTTTTGNQAIHCCPDENVTHPQCAPILLSNDDPFYSQFKVTCMNFVRSAVCPTCALGPRQLVNQVTSFIDASFVYGITEIESIPLRRLDGTGQLKTLKNEHGDLLPKSFDPINDRCSSPLKNKFCFESGDHRVNENPVVTSLQTIFHREHNRIASRLKQINVLWGEEKLYQESRRIVGAEMQAITYGEFLPITLNNDVMEHYRLWPTGWTRYDPKENPTTFLEFATAAYRYGHTLAHSAITSFPLSDKFNESHLLRDNYFQPFSLYKGFDQLLKGVVNSSGEWFDRHHIPDLTNYLFRIPGRATGLDLAAITIQRGRDHGLPNYVETLRFCSQDKVNVINFDDLVLNDLVTEEDKKVLQNNYRFVEDIELMTGIFCERYNEGAVVGPTAACLIGLQFHKLKFGDRFYFEHVNEVGSFTLQQVEELRKVTLSQIICLNTKVDKMPEHAMLFARAGNPEIDCNKQKGVDLSYWK